MDQMAELNKKLTTTVKAYKEHNVKFALFATKHQDCKDSAKCGHGAAVKEIITHSDWINLPKETKRKRKRKTGKADDKTSPNKKSKRDIHIIFPSRKRKNNEPHNQTESKRIRTSTRDNTFNAITMNTIDGEKTIGYKLKYKKHPIPSSTPTFYERVLNSIEENNLPYKVNHETRADGNCFYHALYEIFNDIPLLMQRAKEKLNTQSIDAKVLKKSIMDHMSKYDLTNLICECPTKCQGGQAHLSYLKGNNIWADEWVLKYATTLFNIKINLVEHNGDIQTISWDPTPSDINIYMFYFPLLHYQSLQLKEHNEIHEIRETNPDLEEYFPFSDQELYREDDDFDSINADDSNNIHDENHSLSNNDLNIIKSLPLE